MAAGLVNVGGTLYFTAYAPAHGTELWKSDGTADGTTRVQDSAPGAASSFPDDLTAVGGTLFFTRYSAKDGYQLWVSDGTPHGTRLVSDITPGSEPIPLGAAGAPGGAHAAGKATG